MKQFNITFKLNGKLYTSRVKKVSHDNAATYSIALEHDELQKAFNAPSVVFVEQFIYPAGVTPNPSYLHSVHYLDSNKKNVQFERSVWSAIHDVFDINYLQPSNPFKRQSYLM